GMIVPQLCGQQRQRSSPNIQNVNRMRRSQRGKPLDTFLVARAVAHKVISSTAVKFLLADKSLIHAIEIKGFPWSCHQVNLLLGIPWNTTRRRPWASLRKVDLPAPDAAS